MNGFSVVVVTAAPTGQAAEAGGAYVKVDGREALLRSVELFLNRDNVKQILLVVAPEEMDEAKRKYGAHLGFSGVKLLAGGPKWIDQLAVTAGEISGEATHVIVHDAARPAVPYSDIDALFDAADKHPAVVLATPERTPLVEIDEGGRPIAYYRADQFMQRLTPQAFSKERFLAMISALEEPHASEISLLKGSPLNVRLAGPGDATIVKAMLNMLPKPKKNPLTSPFEEAQW